MTIEYSPAEIEAISAKLLDAHIKKPVQDSAIYKKTTAERFISKKKEFSATKGDLTLPVRLAHGNGGLNDGLQGIGPGSELHFYNPANARRARFTRRKHHIGITISEDELEDYGVTVTDSPRRTSGGGTSQHPQLIDGLNEKMSDFNEQHDEKFSGLIWGDGSLDPLALSGIRSIILDDPTQGVVGGLSCALNTKWRNHAFTTAHAASGGQGAITSSTAGGGELMQVLAKDNRQLQRFGGRVSLRACGSDFLDALEREIRGNGNYSDMGFSKSHEADVGGVSLSGVTFVYDPELDNIGRQKFSYAIDERHLCLYVRSGMWKQLRNPERPYNRLVMHKSLVTTCMLAADQLNCHAVYQIN